MADAHLQSGRAAVGSRTRRGFVLLTVLFVLALMAVALAGVCRTGLRRTMRASDAADELQRRWGATSLRTSLLPHADDLVDAANVPGAAPVSTVHLAAMLGGQRFDLDVADEQAKANVNALYAATGSRPATEAAVRELAAAAGVRATPRLTMAVKPPHRKAASTDAEDQAADSAGGRPAAAVGSPSEVFPDADFDALRAATANLTCWGNGRVNVVRASAAVLRRMLSPELSAAQVQRLLAARADRPADKVRVDDLIAAAGADTAAGLIASDRLTTVSTVHSVWLVARGRSGTTRALWVRDETVSDDVRVFTFQW